MTDSEQTVVARGFAAHSQERNAPEYRKEFVKWLAFDDKNDLIAALTADVLWDWMYVDELWVHANLRDRGLGKRLMILAGELAQAEGLQGIWLWTQSWQAEEFYARLGYEEFARFENAPKGHTRIGFRKQLP
ncbi:MAG: GNAT family N-acetyltransferase [Woeseiaceae bacterium]|nr:GNAT family N-acetyltransferase [Woeseiaceae bacterium]